jgi:hypothetical protein
MSNLPDFNIPDVPVLPKDDPIAELLEGPRIVEMTDDELLQYTKDMRVALESPQTLRKLLAAGTKIKKASSKKAKPTIDTNALFDL